MTSNEISRLRTLGWEIEDRACLLHDVWELSGEPVESAYEKEYQAALSAIEDRSIWFRWRNKIIAEALRRHGTPQSLWDVGAGNGSVARYLQDEGVDVVAVEPGAAGAEAAAARGVRTVIRGAFEDLHLPEGCLETVGLFDVLEHLAEPISLLRTVCRTLRGGGLLVVSVPALPALWSHADVVDGHYRRYTRRTLRTELGVSGFRVDAMNYHFAAIVPQAFLTRVVPWKLGLIHDEGPDRYFEQLGRESRLLTSVAKVAGVAEAAWARLFPVPVGTSLVAAARPN